MKLLKKSIITLENPIEVFDLTTCSPSHNFCLSNGIVVHNSKDVADSVAGAVQNLYLNLEIAGQLSNQYIAKSSAKALAERGRRPIDKFQEMINSMSD